jgi:hypothetical protein
MKKYNSSEVESIHVLLSETKNPICFKNKLNELINQAGMTEQEARNFINTTEFELEVYYEEGQGLFAVESEAVESTEIFSPYSKEQLDEADEDE